MLGEDAYEVTGARKRDDGAELAAHLISSQPVEEDVTEKPSWAKSWEEKKRPKLTGTCNTWNKKGFGFIKRDDSAADVFVHQRSIMQRGFRSLLEGELRADSDAQTPLLYMSVRPAARPRVHTTLSPLR